MNSEFPTSESMIELISQKQDEYAIVEAKKKQAKIDAIEAEAEKLMPLYDILNNAIRQYGYSVTMHKDPTHQPCPAIHTTYTRSSRKAEHFGEIANNKDGGNSIFRTVTTDPRYFESTAHIVDYIAGKIAEEHSKV
tara:strand:- start:96 stop:503 length:408 start_codon:yes stop_codon:yes gene_type:complete